MKLDEISVAKHLADRITSPHAGRAFVSSGKNWILGGMIITHAPVNELTDKFTLYSIKKAKGLIDNKFIKGKFKDDQNRFVIDPSDLSTDKVIYLEHELIKEALK